MGMAASQARFLGLTARKTNTEYEGQQVNQQRTALANESSGLFNKMLKLNVPIPPDPNNFYNMRYSFAHGGTNYQITGYTPGTEAGTYNINVQYTEEISKLYKKQQNDLYIGLDNDNKMYAELNGMNMAITKDTYPALASELGLAPTTEFYSYAVPSTDSAGARYYFTEDEYQAFLDGKPMPGPGEVVKGNLMEHYYASASEVNYGQFSNVSIAKNEQGQFTTVTIDGITESLNLENVRDDIGYENAMYLYTTEKDRYDRTIADINTQTEVIQQQDRTLELRLKQLDTEQSALQTEMEAVQKVIEKNVESTFKTFA